MSDNKSNTPVRINFSFDPTEVVKESEKQLMTAFKNSAHREVSSFFEEQLLWGGTPNTTEKRVGAGLLLIRDLLEKKFDDPKTMKHMEEYFEANFERIMEQAMEKALQHKANAFVFQKVKAKTPTEGEER